jgi:hypothetical protein
MTRRRPNYSRKTHWNFGVEFGHSNAISWSSRVQHQGQQLLDLYLYVSYHNYWDQVSPAFTKILPWYANYIIPPARRSVAVARTKHLGIRSLDMDDLNDVPTGQNGQAGVSPATTGTLNSAQNSPEALLARQRTATWLRTQKHSDTFQLHQLSEAFFGPLEELLGRKSYLLSDDGPSSLDCIALGYLSLMLFPPLTHRWLADAFKQRHPQLKKYTERFYHETFDDESDSWKDKIVDAPIPTAVDAATFIGKRLFESVIPSSKTLINYDSSQRPVQANTKYSSPSSIMPIAFLAAGAIAGVAFAATKLINTSKESDNVFAHDNRNARPVRLADMGEAGAAFAAAFGSGVSDQVERQKEFIGDRDATIVEVDVEGADGTVGRDIYTSK